jgi:hypothetical protein
MNRPAPSASQEALFCARDVDSVACTNGGAALLGRRSGEVSGLENRN